MDGVRHSDSALRRLFDVESVAIITPTAPTIAVCPFLHCCFNKGMLAGSIEG